MFRQLAVSKMSVATGRFDLTLVFAALLSFGGTVVLASVDIGPIMPPSQPVDHDITRTLNLLQHPYRQSSAVDGGVRPDSTWLTPGDDDDDDRRPDSVLVDKRPGSSALRYVGLGKRATGAIKYIGLGRRADEQPFPVADDDATSSTGDAADEPTAIQTSRRAGGSALRYVGLGKRPKSGASAGSSSSSAMRYIGLGKRKSMLAYVGLGRRSGDGFLGAGGGGRDDGRYDALQDAADQSTGEVGGDVEDQLPRVVKRRRSLSSLQQQRVMLRRWPSSATVSGYGSIDPALLMMGIGRK